MLSAALLLSLFAALAEDPAGEQDEAPAEAEEFLLEDSDPEALPEELDGFMLPDGEDLGDLEVKPERTTAPTQAPKDIPWLSSVNYPADKINFEGEIWSTLTGRWGLAEYQAAGLMSSILAESSFCPYNVQGRGGSDDRGTYVYDVDDSVGFGLCQWTSSGRKAALRSYAARHGSEDLVWDFDIQMGYMASEIDLAALKSTRTLYEAAEWAVLRYERPDQSHANSWPGTRYEKSRQIFKNHTGRRYKEPKLRFRVESGGGDALGAGECVVGIGAPAKLTVQSNFYWRLEQKDATADGWLEVRCPSLYRPDQLEECVCGYACDGEKPLTLTVAKLPPVGRTWRTTLCFEIYRGRHTVKTLPVSVTCTMEDALRLAGIDPVRLIQAAGIAYAVLGEGFSEE